MKCPECGKEVVKVGEGKYECGYCGSHILYCPDCKKYVPTTSFTASDGQEIIMCGECLEILSEVDEDWLIFEMPEWVIEETKRKENPRLFVLKIKEVERVERGEGKRPLWRVTLVAKDEKDRTVLFEITEEYTSLSYALLFALEGVEEKLRVRFHRAQLIRLGIEAQWQLAYKGIKKAKPNEIAIGGVVGEEEDEVSLS